ncbi:NADH dehydrogenase [ubiquinone] 1 alpha subcomplex subunit 5 [Chrysoperla carnea]|uniref:NADH dehydrogenase [ubiquinone] 1 alpha subcomplex subunit 5 n=1 Tax=Chrysoperla carnea TaxID=189513 RepID=UPI001D07AD65|nr:NADH dehydrogenase [ubiquinone] 1 alpha subcomplex subunit 5 [Chrysoperla carnea]
MASRTILKRTTGITGLEVATNPHHTLNVLYGKILRALQKMPESAAYRRSTEEIVKSRAAIVNSSNDVATIEKQINCGQIEEVILQAEKELILTRKMLGWKPWEPLAKKSPPDQWVWPPITPVKQA